MTVQELIDQLSKIEDKSKDVATFDNYYNDYFDVNDIVEQKDRNGFDVVLLK